MKANYYKSVGLALFVGGALLIGTGTADAQRSRRDQQDQSKPQQEQRKEQPQQARPERRSDNNGRQEQARQQNEQRRHDNGIGAPQGDLNNPHSVNSPDRP